MCFGGLCASMRKGSMKVPRVDYVNMVYWGEPPYRGSTLWSLLKHYFRSKLLEKNRASFYEAVYANTLLKPTDPVHLDSVVASVTMIRISCMPLFGSEKDFKEAESW